MILRLIQSGIEMLASKVKSATFSCGLCAMFFLLVGMFPSKSMDVELAQDNFYFLHDEAKAFYRDPKKAAKLEQMLRSFQQKHGCPLHIITTSSTSYGNNLMLFSNDKRKTLLQNNQGFVLIYEVDSGSFNLSIRPIDEDSSREDWTPSLVPQHYDRELQQTWEKRIKTNSDRKQLQGEVKGYDPMDSCYELSTALMDTYGEFAANTTLKDTSIISESGMKLTIAAMILLAGFLSAILHQRRVNSKLAEEKFVFHFPVTPTPTLFGSANGAEMSTVKFGKSENSPSH